MAILQPYEKYYPVKYDYLAELPDGWQLLPNIAIFRERKEKGTKNEELLSIVASRGVIKTSDYELKKDRSTEDKSEYLLIKEGDLAYNTMLTWIGAYGYSQYRGIVSPAYTVLKPIIKINPKFFHYQFRNNLYKNYSKRYAYGIMDVRLRLYYFHFKRMYSVVPPLEIQNRIVEYLDKKNSEIDKFIQNKERLISLLEEQRKAFITQNIFHKISQIKPLKYLVSKVGSGVTPLGGANVYISAGITFLRSQNIHFNELRLDDVAFISENIHFRMKSTKVKKNDVLLNITGASIGRCCAIENNIDANVNQHVCIIRPKKELDSKYLSYYLTSTNVQSLIRNCQDGASREGLSFSEIKSFPIPIINIEEQLDIVKIITKKEAEIDKVISKAKQEISSIKEYRETLITDLVTGKRSIPQS